ncbi:MAG: HU family DNA-binding protein [Firmicutes bacterium]|nr:HU family DNA-binding protein [Bacillota bacterium]
MKQSEFIEILASRTDLPVKESSKIVDDFWSIIVETLKKGDEVVFKHGKFVLVKKAAREGRNPLTGETVKIAASVAPKFKPGKKLKDDVKA